MTPTPYTPEDIVAIMLAWSTSESRGTAEEVEWRLAECWRVAYELGIGEGVAELLRRAPHE